ncbi:MAG: hypothetical protein ACTHK0_19120 [Ginsengibacter sp.]
MTREKKQKILLLIPLAIITGLLIYSWSTFLLTNTSANWRHYLALGLFAVLVYFYFKSFAGAVIATGLYLLLATLNALSMTPQKITYWFSINSIESPNIPIVSLVVFVTFLVLNFDTLFNIYLDYKEVKAKRKT